ncbi:MAG: carboxypeptidase-like regulatory domain-containing protein [Bacteroidales bacterium]|nr:carboxypeptidase-like regulatory domain-containing protein [Bacteroidales bacterium]
MRVFFILIIIFNAVFVSGQIYEGRIINAETGMAVPFANIRYHQNKGVISDIDGRYTVKASDVDSLKVSYVGFRSKTVEAVAGKRQIIELIPKVIDLAEVVIKPGINPAMRIVKNLIENKAINNPDNYNSYSYRAYDKLVFTVHEDKVSPGIAKKLPPTPLL